MRKIISALLLLCSLAVSKVKAQQPLEVVIVATSHYNARRVLVAVGASHGQTMREILVQMPQVKVRTYNDLP